MKSILPFVLIVIGLMGMFATPVHSAISVIILAISLGCLASGIILIIANSRYRPRIVQKASKTQNNK